jgi:hypothetical protein
MNSPLSTLRDSLSKLQRAAAKLYAQLRERFGGNTLVSEMWAAMANDLQVQVDSLKRLPPSFWQSLKTQEKELARVEDMIVPLDAGKPAVSLQSCLALILALEEPIILGIYPSLIRRLRTHWTDLALDFYVMVKAHLARIGRLIQLFSGDPALVQRYAVLLQDFEKEVQEPVEVAAIPARSKQKQTRSARHTRKTVGSRPRVAAEERPARSLDKIANRAKPLVKKIEISRRRARR